MTLDYNDYYSEVDSSKIKFPPDNKKDWWGWRNEDKKDEHSDIDDPQFVDPTKYNFNIKPSSPVIKLGF